MMSHDDLIEQDRKIMAMSRRGKSNPEIADAIGRSSGYVKDRISNLRRQGRLPEKQTGIPRTDLGPLECEAYRAPKGDHDGFAKLMREHQPTITNMAEKRGTARRISPAMSRSPEGSAAFTCAEN